MGSLLPSRPSWLLLGVFTVLIGVMPLVLDTVPPGGEYVWLPLTAAAGVAAMVFAWHQSLCVLRWWINCVAVLATVRVGVFASEGRASAPWVWAVILTLAIMAYGTNRDRLLRSW